MTEAAQNSNIFNNINGSYFQLTLSEKKVADYVLSHKTEAQFMSISELAEACGVAEATISRFCRRLQLRGYSDFKLSLAKAAGQRHPGNTTSIPGELPLDSKILPSDTVHDMCRKLYTVHSSAMAQSMALVDAGNITRAVDILRSANRVYCMGQGGSMLMANETAHLFSTVSPCFSSVVDSHTQISTAALLGSNDVVMYFSYSGSTRDSIDLMEQVRQRKAKTILFTRFPKSPAAAMADIVIACGSSEGPLQIGSMAARIAQLYLVDLLFNEYCRRDLDSAMANRELVANALVDKHL